MAGGLVRDIQVGNHSPQVTLQPRSGYFSGQTNQIGGQLREPIIAIFGPAVFDRYVALST
jgi:hypothetical protein